jgi:hypothetical protein
MMIFPPTAPWVPIFVMAILIFGGVVLPAVWSRRPQRRCAAWRVLKLLISPLAGLAAVIFPGPSAA